MKKILLILALLMPMALLAQDKVADAPQSKSKTLEFLEKDGSFIHWGRSKELSVRFSF